MNIQFTNSITRIIFALAPAAVAAVLVHTLRQRSLDPVTAQLSATARDMTVAWCPPYSFPTDLSLQITNNNQHYQTVKPCARLKLSIIATVARGNIYSDDVSIGHQSSIWLTLPSSKRHGPISQW